ncbi:MAG: hypothetical protein COA94_06575 [Rickettsiales bacterium]|nr:MAG: hypothetical protein COA94_06575 [Rickettsiales bacterium]
MEFSQSMEFSQFHFAHSYYFLGILIIPIIWWLYLHYYENNANTKDLENFADSHLVPHLLRSSKTGQISVVRSLVLGSVLWLLLMAAMAGPRWDFKEVETYKDDKSLVILLDLSKSMDASDITPSRLVRARQEIEDIINSSKGVKVGLVGFAAGAHMISPITDDMNNIRRLLPLLGTDLVFVQGTSISPAFKTAKQMLLAEPGVNKSILVISDGGFQDDNHLSIVKNLAGLGVVTHTLGVGTEKGVNFIGADGQPMMRGGQVLTSRLEKEKLEATARAGSGEYFNTHYSNENAKNILKLVEGSMFGAGNKHANIHHWEERFYIFLAPLMLVLLLWFRKGFTFPILLLVLLTPAPQVLGASLVDKIFLNKEQLAKKSFEEVDDIGSALAAFDDPYKRGVAYYKAGMFKKAEKEFRKNKRPEVSDSALYNLAGALAHQNKLDESIETYKKLLKKNPNHKKTRHNMGVVRSMVFVKEEKKEQEEKKKPPKNEDDEKFPSGGGGGGDDEDDEGESGDESDDSGKGDEKDDSSGEGDDSDKDKGGSDDDGDKDSDSKDKKDSDGADEKKGDKDEDTSGDEASGKDEAEIDQLLDLISNDHKNFLKNQFQIESGNSKTKPTNDPW